MLQTDTKCVIACDFAPILRTECPTSRGCRFHSRTLPRAAFTSARTALPCRRRCFDPQVGLVGRRTACTCEASATMACKRPSASALFCSRLRDDCALITITPCLFRRWSGRASKRSFTSSGSDEAHTSKRNCTERDYARKVALMSRSSKDTAVSEIMTTAVMYVHPRQTNAECMALMTDKRVRHLPVMDEGKLLGLISIGDLVKDIISEQEFIIQQLQHYITGERA